MLLIINRWNQHRHCTLLAAISQHHWPFINISFVKVWIRCGALLQLGFNMVAVTFNSDSRYKLRLAGSLLVHSLLLTPTLLKLTAELCEKLNVTPFHIDEYHIPKASLWEYVWSASLIFICYGVYALARNNVYKLAIFIVGDILFGVVPVTIAVYSHHHDQLFSYHGNRFDFYWYGYSVLVLVVHLLSLYFAIALRASWKAALLTAVTQKRQ